MLSLRFFVLSALLAACSVASAQYTAGRIIFKNSAPYSQAELEAVAGLHPHDKVSSETVQAAAQRLMDTGYFSDVDPGLEGAVNGVNITFGLKPLAPSQMTRAGFANFIWLTPEELKAIVHKASPLFRGSLPEAGNQTEAITAALQAALVAKGVTAEVVHSQIEPSPSQPFRVMEYRVAQPAVFVHAVKLSGVSPALATEVQKAETAAQRNPYNEGIAYPSTTERLLEPYMDAGYLDAKLSGLERTIADTKPGVVNLDVTATVEAGEPYHVTALSYEGTPLASKEAVLASAKLHVGDVASRKLLMETLAPIDAAYRHQGYMDVVVDTGATPDKAAHTISYAITVTSGEQYRVKSVDIIGLPPEARTYFDRGWRMNPGELYDSLYVAEFLKNNTALRALEGYAGTFRASADPQSRQVDLTIKFVHLAR